MNLGVVIPGLAMTADEIPKMEGAHVLQNPGVGGRPDLNQGYSLEDLAALHAEEIKTISKSEPFVAVGMSMGGMILSILASRHREVFPKNTRFIYLVTSANTPELPAITKELLAQWFTVKPGDAAGFRSVVFPFFSKSFLSSNYEEANAYALARAHGANQQSPQAFVSQVRAVQKFDGKTYFSQVNGSESHFIGGEDDYIFGPRHNLILKNLVPDAIHEEILAMGHMVNLERPKLIKENVNGHNHH